MLSEAKHKEPILLSRECDAVQIPSGIKTTLLAGTQVTIHQQLGGSFTVYTDAGYLVRIDGNDADALGLQVAPTLSAEAIEAVERGDLNESVIYEVLSTCYDPEIPVNIVELGLIYGCEVSTLETGGKRVDVVMTLTAPGCGMGQVLRDDIDRKVSKLKGVEQTHVEVVFDPPWDQTMMSDAARLQLGMM